MKRFKVTHQPQVDYTDRFEVEVNTLSEAELIADTLANQHLWLRESKFIPDYSNIIFIEVFLDGEWVEVTEDDIQENIFAGAHHWDEDDWANFAVTGEI